MHEDRPRISRAELIQRNAIAVEERARVGLGVDIDVAELDERDVVARVGAERLPEAFKLAPRITVLRDELFLDEERDAGRAGKLLHPLQDVRADRLVAEVDALVRQALQVGAQRHVGGVQICAGDEKRGHKRKAQHPR